MQSRRKTANESLGKGCASGSYHRRAFDIGVLRSIGFLGGDWFCQHRCARDGVTSAVARCIAAPRMFGVLPTLLQEDLRETEHGEFGAVLGGCNRGCARSSIPASDSQSDCRVKTNEQDIQGDVE